MAHELGELPHLPGLLLQVPGAERAPEVVALEILLFERALPDSPVEPAAEGVLGHAGALRSILGEVFPVYHVLADAGELCGGSVIPSNLSAPLKTESLVLKGEGHTRILVANMSPEPQDVRIVYAGLGEFVRVKHLDKTNVEQAVHCPESFRADPDLLQQTADDRLKLSLLPYAIARVDTVGTVNR